LLAYHLWALRNGRAAAPLEMRIVVGSMPKTEGSLFIR
jgi:hypothetical protein